MISYTLSDVPQHYTPSCVCEVVCLLLVSQNPFLKSLKYIFFKVVP